MTQVEFIDGMEREAFLEDRKTQYAVIRCLEVIGEAGKQVSQEVREGMPDLPWSGMARTRDLLIHSYAKIDLVEVYLTARRDLPSLIAVLERQGLEELQESDLP